MQFIGTGDRILTENFNVGYLYTITFKTGIYINSACIGIGDTFVMFQKAEPDLLFTLNVDTADEVDTIELYDSGGGTNDYDDLVNRPQINSHTLTGNMSGSDLGLQDTISDIDTIRAGAAAGATAVQPAALSDYQPKIDSTHMLSADLVDDTSTTHKFATQTQLDQIGINENNISLLNQYAGGKNKFNIDSATINASDASYTKNSDGTINVTKSTNTVGQVAMTQAFLGETGTYIISGCPSGGSSTTYEMLIQSGNTVLARDYGEGASVSLTNGTNYQFKVVVRESQTLSNKLFKPMISVEGGDYQPYAMSNAEITAWILAHS